MTYQKLGGERDSEGGVKHQNVLFIFPVRNKLQKKQIIFMNGTDYSIIIEFWNWRHFFHFDFWKWEGY